MDVRQAHQMVLMDFHPRILSTRMDSRRLRDDRRLRTCPNPSVQTECHMVSHSGWMREDHRLQDSISAPSHSVRMGHLALP